MHDPADLANERGRCYIGPAMEEVGMTGVPSQQRGSERFKTSKEPPDVAALMKQVRAMAARLIQERGTEERARLVRLRRRGPSAIAGLNDFWDVWRLPEIATHRGRLGEPIVWLKRVLLTLLAPHNRELLRRQREFNACVKDELTSLKYAVELLTARLDLLESDAKVNRGDERTE